jgi:hypothetical protein
MTARSLAPGFLMPKDADQSTKAPLPEEVESGHGEGEVG